MARQRAFERSRIEARGTVTRAIAPCSAGATVKVRTMSAVAMNPFLRPTPRLKNPRLFGLLLLGCGLVLNALNAYESIHDGKYYAIALMIGPFACLFGLWRLV